MGSVKSSSAIFLLIFVCFCICSATTETISSSNPSTSSSNSRTVKWEQNKKLLDSDNAKFNHKNTSIFESDIKFCTNNDPLGLYPTYLLAKSSLKSGDYKNAISLLEKCEKGEIRGAFYELGQLYEYGEHVPRDIKKAVDYYKKSADLGDPRGQRAYAFMLDNGRGVTKDSAKAFLYYTFASEQLDFEANMVLGNKFQYGYNTIKSCSSAAMKYRYAAKQVIKELQEKPYLSMHANLYSLSTLTDGGDDALYRDELLDFAKFEANPDSPESILKLGVLYLYGYYGHGVDYNLAKSYFEQLNLKEVPLAAALLGRMNLYGLGMPQNYKKAKELFQLAHDKKNPEGIIFLGEMYRKGQGMNPDYAKALQIFNSASQMGIQDGFLNLGIMYYEGQGVDVDYEKAFSLFKSSLSYQRSIQSAEAYFYYGEMIHYGIGFSSDCATAVSAYRSVIEKGHWIKQLDKASNAYMEGDHILALTIYEKIAETGNRLAQMNAGWICDTMQEEEISLPHIDDILSLAVKYYTKASDQGDNQAHLKLGDYYYYGRGNLPVNHKTAASYYFPVINYSPQARFNYAYMHQFGEGVPKDIFIAKSHYDILLNMNPSSFLAVYLCYINLGYEYSLMLISEGKTDQLIADTITFFTPEVFFRFYDQIIEDYKENGKQQTSNTPKQSFLDTESMFGYNWDTVLIVTIITTLTITLLFRFGIVQIQVA